jgi:hypothetical protein
MIHQSEKARAYLNRPSFWRKPESIGLVILDPGMHRDDKKVRHQQLLKGSDHV